MSAQTKAVLSALLAAAVLSLMVINIWGDVEGWAAWAVIVVQLLIVAVQIAMVRSQEVRS
jgi:hypothetical protein